MAWIIVDDVLLLLLRRWLVFGGSDQIVVEGQFCGAATNFLLLHDHV